MCHTAANVCLSMQPKIQARAVWCGLRFSSEATRSKPGLGSLLGCLVIHQRANKGKEERHPHKFSRLFRTYVGTYKVMQTQREQYCSARNTPQKHHGEAGVYCATGMLLEH